jgi:hypothetical protein
MNIGREIEKHAEQLLLPKSWDTKLARALAMVIVGIYKAWEWFVYD